MKEGIKKVLAVIDDPKLLDRPKTWTWIIAISVPLCLLSVIVFRSTVASSFLHDISKFAGLGFAFNGWVGFCALAGIKRERQMMEEHAKLCPYKIENPRGERS